MIHSNLMMEVQSKSQNVQMATGKLNRQCVVEVTCAALFKLIQYE